MTDEHHPGEPDDAAFQRLRDADPAAKADPDLDRIRALLDARTGDAGARRSWRWSQIAAAVAAVLVVGAGGYALGSVNRSGSGAAASPSTAATTSAVQPTAAAEAVAPDIAVPGMAPSYAAGAGSSGRSASYDSSLAWGGAYRTIFRDGGLSTDAGVAHGYSYDGSQLVSAATAERVAAALGVEGSARDNGGFWSVGSDDGTGPNVTVNADGRASFYYFNPALQPPVCGVSEPAAGSDDPASPTAAVLSPCTPQPTVEPIAAEDAIARSQQLMSTLGIDPSGFEFTPQESPKELGTVAVGAAAVIGDARTESVWWFQFTGDQVSSASGALAPLIDLGEYPTISPAAAVARLGDPRFGASGPIFAVDAAGAPEPAPMPAPTAVTAPPAPVAGQSIPWPISEVTIADATLGLAEQYLPNGQVMVVPTYTLTDGSGASWTVIAVADDKLDFTTG